LRVCFPDPHLPSDRRRFEAKFAFATASPSLSYLPIYTAVKKGFFAKRGLDVEMIQMSASLTAPALLNRSIDYTTIPSTIATAAARSAPAKVIFFASVKLQHMLLARPEIATVNDLAGRRIAASGFGNLTSYEIQYVIDRYKLGPQTTLVSVISSTGPFACAAQRHRRSCDHLGAAGFERRGDGSEATAAHGNDSTNPTSRSCHHREKLKTKRSEVLDVLKAGIEGLEYTQSEREDNSAIISRWMGLTAAQGAKAYDSVKDTFSRNGIPTDEQSRAYIAMLAATAGVSSDLAAAAIFDFSFAAAAAKELTAKK
jgi:ABC-type nitrate/sulfonate/bicarbonate transport system substrate-binding protein